MMLRKMTTVCLPVLAAVLAALPALGAESGGSNDSAPVFEQPPAGTTDFTGKWAMSKPGGHLLTAEGGEPPLNAAGKATLEASKKRYPLLERLIPTAEAKNA